MPHQMVESEGTDVETRVGVKIKYVCFIKVKATYFNPPGSSFSCSQKQLGSDLTLPVQPIGRPVSTNLPWFSCLFGSAPYRSSLVQGPWFQCRGKGPEIQVRGHHCRTIHIKLVGIFTEAQVPCGTVIQCYSS